MKPNETAMMMNSKPLEVIINEDELQDKDYADRIAVDNKAAPINVANHAGDAIEASHHSAELLRSQGTMIMSIAQTIKTEGDALAVDIESRAERFSVMVATFNEYAAQAKATFATERERLDQFKMPS